MKKAFVIGDPIAHSRSPMIHRYWIARHGLQASYDAIHVKHSDLASFIQTVRDGAYVGGNVTLPHKEAVAGLVDQISDTAKMIGAVNTIYRDDASGKLFGDNTDAFGFSANLDQWVPAWRNGKKAVVVGAGGAARAIVHALIEAGFGEITIVNRTVAKAQSLADAFAGPCRAIGFERLKDELQNTDCLVNTTSLGMKGQPPLEIDLTAAPKTMAVNDIVYTPLETDLLKQARNLGLSTIDGLGMLLHQAVPGFERWFDVRPLVDDTLRSLIVADLGKAG